VFSKLEEWLIDRTVKKPVFTTKRKSFESYLPAILVNRILKNINASNHSQLGKLFQINQTRFDQNFNS